MADHIQEQKAVQESAPAQQQAPAQASAPVQRNGVVNDQDVKFWTDRANDFLARPSEHIHSRSPNGAQSWFAGFFDCFNPIDTCLITWCLPCVTFGQVQHRIQRSGELEGFEPLNTSCLLLCGAACVGCFCVPVAMQRQMIREKYNLEGNCIEDIARTFCCGCCSIVQHDKEAQHRERLLRQGSVDEQYKTTPGMSYPPQ
ncbi:Protein PLANT CADMIUM RESISTANCE 3 [Beauveria bassiana]|uniref:PLAC8 family protein n=1 Tax=Beauveria bassiana (strain ARSEF 2860) TaxID=655819 RepID=J5KA57_BEAB2|nr:PLAC8 family protein [Beauveria bassiana ARSEF 2860]EJP71041.1 PLAC8 family protein [Beauveria bassiana ARSEF 2860]KAF1737004.1 Protein PLANT CADMIUM RESISTANCE 3 [Beauveria bassiana]KAH8717984.1 Protein PLANT CADMIUM RESISTANCE 3 [Beauveria bassiana]